MENNIESELYPLEKVRFIIKDACGIDVAYAYDDLVFAEHGLIVVQFLDKSGDNLACWFNSEMQEIHQVKLMDSLIKTATLNKITLSYKGRFAMQQKPGSEEIDIEFINA
jgi:hypothetical protein